MADIYIRASETEEPRGPFNIPDLQSLGLAGQVAGETLYYDDEREEWIPLSENEALHKRVFPEKEKLQLRTVAQDTEDDDEEGDAITVDEMLAAASADTKDTRHLKKDQKSADRAANISATGLGTIMVLLAAHLLLPHFEIISEAVRQKTYARVLNYPFLIIGVVDFIAALMLFTSVTKIYPLLRIRAMLGLGFALYVGWSISDPGFMALSVLTFVPMFVATLTQRYTVMVVSLLLGMGGAGILTYLSLIGRFTGFLDAISFEWF